MTLYLLMLNLLVLAAGIGIERLGGGAPALGEFNAEKIRFWSQPAAYRPPTPVAPPAAAAPAATQPAAAAGLCLEIAELGQERYQQMRAAVQAAGLDCRYGFDKKLAWWVFWPPEYEAGQRDKAVKALQAAGVKDFLPITQGTLAQSFSLGVFASEAQANQYRDALRGKGLAKVDFGPRPSMGTGRLGCVPADPVRLGAFKSGLPAWAKAVEAGMCALPEAAGAAATPPPR